MSHHRRTLATVLVALGLVVSAPACGSHLQPATPKAAAAITADAVVVRVNELQAAVIATCWPTGIEATTCVPGGLPTTVARDLVQTCLALRSTLLAAPDGWQAAVHTAWRAAQPRFASITLPVLRLTLDVLDRLIDQLVGALTGGR